jgi:flavin reductase (DIM6/NTAB) family NADH-FMN oxidoreductase RutF
MPSEPEKIDLDVNEAIAQLPPAPVMLVASGDKEEDWNVTTIGMFNVFSLFPVVVGIGVKTSRHIFKLISESSDFTINIPPVELMEAVEVCGTESGVRKNKFKEAGLTPVKGRRVKAPVIKECWLNIECRKVTEPQRKTANMVLAIEFEVGDHTWFLGQIMHTEVWTNYDRGRSLLFWDGEYRTAANVIKSSK